MAAVTSTTIPGALIDILIDVRMKKMCWLLVKALRIWVGLFTQQDLVYVCSTIQAWVQHAP